MAELTLTQSAAATVVGRGYLASDHLSTATGLDPAIMISKNGGDFANPAAGASVMTEIESTGWYTFALGADDTDTIGPLIIRGTHATMDNIEVVYQVVAAGVTLADDAITSDKYDESTAFPLYSDTPIVRVGGFIDTAGSVPTDILASAFPADATGYSFISGLDGYGDDALNGAILLDSSSTWMACVTDYVSLTGTITLNKTIPAALQEADFILIPSGGASAADVWANATRTLTALDEDDTTIDLDGITIGTVTTVTNGVTLADDAITSAKFDESTAFPLKAEDANDTRIAREGADDDTLETLSDEIDAVSAAISAIGSGTGAALNYEVVEDNASAPIKSISKKGAQANDFSYTLSNDNQYHTITSQDDTPASPRYNFDWVYGFSVGPARAASKVVVRASMSQTGDTVTVYAYNFVTPGWDSRQTIVGTAETLYDIPLLSRNTGTGTDEGKVYIRFVYAEGDAGALVVDECYVQAQQSGSQVGYQDALIWVDTNGSNTNTTPYVDGTADNPVSTIAAAYTLATATGLKGIRFLAGSSVTLTASAANWRFVGAATIALNGQSIADAVFRDAYTISGTSTGDDAQFVNCGIGTASIAHAYFIDCRFKGTLTMTAAHEYFITGGYDAVSSGACTFVFGANTELMARDYHGGIQLNSMTAGCTAIIDGAGRVVIDGSSTGGTITIRGMFAEATGAATFITAGGTITDTARWAEDQNITTVTGNVTGSIGSLATQAKADVNAEVDTALNTAIPGGSTADSINQRVAAIDDLTQASGAGDLAAILNDTGTSGVIIANTQGAIDWGQQTITANVAGEGAVEIENTNADGYGVHAAGVTSGEWNEGTGGESVGEYNTGSTGQYNFGTSYGQSNGASSGSGIGQINTGTSANVLGYDTTLDDAVLAAIAALNNLSSAGAQAAAAAALAAYGAALEVTAQSILTDTGTTLDDKLDAIDDYIDTEVAAIKAKTDLITSATTINVTGAVSGSTITITRGDTLSADVNGLGNISDYVSLDFTVKENPDDDTDAEAVLRIRLNASGLTDGLLILNGATAADESKGSITIDNAVLGDITIALSADMSDDLVEGTYAYDIQKISATAVTTMTYGTCRVARDVTRAVV